MVFEKVQKWQSAFLQDNKAPWMDYSDWILTLCVRKLKLYCYHHHTAGVVYFLNFSNVVFMKMVSELQASGWVFPIAVADWHLRKGVARRHAINFYGEQLSRACLAVFPINVNTSFFLNQNCVFLKNTWMRNELWITSPCWVLL